MFDSTILYNDIEYLSENRYDMSKKYHKEKMLSKGFDLSYETDSIDELLEKRDIIDKQLEAVCDLSAVSSNKRRKKRSSKESKETDQSVEIIDSHIRESTGYHNGKLIGQDIKRRKLIKNEQDQIQNAQKTAKMNAGVKQITHMAANATKLLSSEFEIEKNQLENKLLIDLKKFQTEIKNELKKQQDNFDKKIEKLNKKIDYTYNIAQMTQNRQRINMMPMPSFDTPAIPPKIPNDIFDI